MVRFPNWIGDAVLSTAGLQYIHRTRPDLHLTGIANPWVAGLFEKSKALSGFKVYDYHRGLKRLPDAVALSRCLRSMSFHAAVLFHGAFESALIPWMAGIPMRIGRPTDHRALFLTHAVKEKSENNRRHQIGIYLDIARTATGVDTQDQIFPELEIADEYLKLADDLIDTMNISGPMIALAPGAAYGSAKRWLPEYYGRLTDMLIEKHKARVMICGGKGDRQVVDRILENCRHRPLDLAGGYPLMTQIAVISRSRAVVANDSGLMHAASAVRTPVVAIFGPTDPVATGPIGSPGVVLKNHMDCAPCHLKECPRKSECMRAVIPEKVMEALEQFIGDEP